MGQRQCQNCKWWLVQSLYHGSCEHPVVVATRYAKAYNAMPYAVKELELRLVGRHDGSTCPTYEATP